MLFLEIVHNLPLTQFEVLGTFEIRIGTLLDIGKDRRGEVLILSFFQSTQLKSYLDVDLKLRPNSDGRNAGVITVRFWSERAANVIKPSVVDAGQSAAAKSMAAVMSKLQMLAKATDKGALVYMHALSGIIGSLTLQMYPYANLVLQVISSVYKVRTRMKKDICASNDGYNSDHQESVGQ
jgi:hypothetical protein